jgi:rod shape-determining protein MreC
MDFSVSPRRTKSVKRGRLALVLLVLAGLTILTLDYRGKISSQVGHLRSVGDDIVSPISSAFRDVAHPVAHFFEGAVDYGSALREENKLKAANGALRRQLAEIKAEHSQVRSLLELNHLPWAGNLAQIDAQVVALASSNFVDTVEIDKGSANGLRKGMPVVSGSGLMGRIIQVTPHDSTVLLITDPRSAVALRFGSGSLALGVGQGAGKDLRVDYISPSTPVEKGEMMFTSGLQGGLFPPGIPVGRVASVSLPRSALEKQVTLAPLANLAQPVYVAVLKWTPSSS